MSVSHRSWPVRFVRWLFGSPFQKLPPPYGNTVPPELLQFEAEAAEAQRRSLGQVAGRPPSHHRKTSPARQDSALERQ